MQERLRLSDANTTKAKTSGKAITSLWDSRARNVKWSQLFDLKGGMPQPSSESELLRVHVPLFHQIIAISSYNNPYASWKSSLNLIPKVQLPMMPDIETTLREVAAPSPGDLLQRKQKPTTRRRNKRYELLC